MQNSQSITSFDTSQSKEVMPPQELIIDTSELWGAFISELNEVQITINQNDKEELFAQITEILLFLGENAGLEFNNLPNFERLSSRQFRDYEFNRLCLSRALRKLAAGIYKGIYNLGGFIPGVGFPYRLIRLLGDDLVLSFTPD